MLCSQYSYRVIGWHSRLFPAIKRPAKINLPNVDYFSTWQFDLYEKSDSNPSEIQGMTHCRVHRSVDNAKKFKRFLKEIYQIEGWVDGWRHWLTNYTNKESTFHNIATFHTTIPTVEIFLNFFFSALFCYAVLPTHLWLMRHHARAPTNGVQQLVHSAPTIEKHWSELCHSYAQNKAQKHHPREFSGYWWLFWTQNLWHYSTRLVEETILIFGRFRFATLK